MTREEMVEKIVSKSGITREQAEEALEKNNNDLLDAMIYVERTYMNAQKTYGSYGYNGESQSPQQSFQNLNDSKSEVHEQSEIMKTLKKLIRSAWKTQLSVSYKGGEVMSMPLLIWILFFMVSASALLLVMIISLFFDVRYYIKGNEMNAKKVNGFLDCAYSFIGKIKRDIVG